jgi:HAMP domain-containing protein
VRAEQHSGGAAANDEIPGSRLSVRGGPSSSHATGTRPREESTPPTKPSIAPPSASEKEEAAPAVRPDSPLEPFHNPAPTLAYGMALAIGGAAVGLGGLLASASAHPGTWASGLSSVLAALTLVFSLSMAVVITLSFARRLSALGEAGRKLAYGRAAPPADENHRDAIASLARSLSRLADRNRELESELERSSEREQGRLDALVRERTRGLGDENEDLRRALGDSKGVLGVDRYGKLSGQSSPVVSKWLGTPPHEAHLWDYFERAVLGAGARFESGWQELLRQPPGALDLRCMPRTLAIGERYLSLDYRVVRTSSGELSRVLVVLTDITIPEPDPATPG